MYRKRECENKKNRVFLQNLSVTIRTLCMVGVTGFEPAASTSQMSRATNCATPRYIKLYQIKLEKSSSTVVVKYRVKT